MPNAAACARYALAPLWEAQAQFPPVLPCAIAFGLGAKDAAKDFIEKRIKKEPEPKEENFSHL